MAFECPRRSSPPSPMFDADTGCIATDPAPSARRRFRSKTGIENLPANEHAQETPHTPSPTRTTRRIQSGCAGSRPRLRDGMPGSPSQHIDITRAKWIPYCEIYACHQHTPRFPDGLTVLDAAGQWRDGSGAIMRERTKLVIVLAKPGAAEVRYTVERPPRVWRRQPGYPQRTGGTVPVSVLAGDHDAPLLRLRSASACSRFW